MGRLKPSEIKVRYILAVEAIGSLMMERPELIGCQDYKPLIDALEDMPALIDEVERLTDSIENLEFTIDSGLAEWRRRYQ